MSKRAKQTAKAESIPYRQCITGCAAALVVYLALQLLLAALVDRETLALERMSAALGLSAGASVFLGGLLAGRGEGRGRAIIAGVVRAGFLLAILAISLAGGARPWAASAGGGVLLGSLAGGVAASLLGGGRKKHKRK